MKKNLPDMPKIVLQHMKLQRMNRRELADACAWAPSTITALFKKRDWTESELKQVGRAIKVDLMVYLLDTPIDGMVPASVVEELNKELNEVKQTLKAKEEENLVLRTENKLLRELMDKR